MSKCFFVMVLLSIVFINVASAQNLHLTWDVPTEKVDGSSFDDFSHFNLKYGTTQGGPYEIVSTALTAEFTLEGLSERSYYAVVSAVDLSGSESGYSNELTIDARDSDRDGLINSYEDLLGTDKNNSDSDNDGVSDGDEVRDETNPLDAVSHMPRHESRICAPWNGFLIDDFGRSMWNIFEHINASDELFSVNNIVHDINGNIADASGFSINAGTQVDLLIHDSSARIQNSYGMTCSETTADAGSLRGNMVYYKESSSRANAFDFALAIPATPPRADTQYTFINTFNPSLDPVDASNALAIWGQVINNSLEEQVIDLFFWVDKELFSQESVRLAANSRQDLALHGIGANKVGYVEWRPRNRSADVRFKIDSTRFLYDNAELRNSFDSAFILPSAKPSGELLGVPFNTIGETSILEIANVRESAVNIALDIYSSEGELILAQVVSLDPKETRHIILDGIAPSTIGLATLKADLASSIIAVAMQYNRTATAGVNYLYGLSAVPAIGSVLTDSFNTYLGQKGKLFSLNLGDEALDIKLTMTRSNGEVVADQEIISLPAKGVSVLDLNQRETGENYGVLKIESSSRHRVVSWVLREREGDYIIPLQAR